MRAVRPVIVAIASIVVVVAVIALARVGGSDEISPTQPAQSAPLSGGSVLLVSASSPITVGKRGTTTFVPNLPATP